MLTKKQKEAVLRAISGALSVYRDQIDENIELIQNATNKNTYAESSLRENMRDREELIKAQAVLEQCEWNEEA